MRRLVDRVDRHLDDLNFTESRRAQVSAGAQITAIMAGLEDLSSRAAAETHAILDRELTTAKNPWLLRLPRKFVLAVCDERFDRPLAAARVAAGVALLLTRRPSRLTCALEAVQLGVTLQQTMRYAGMGRDGSDHALLISQAGLLGASLLRPVGGSAIGLHFIGAQGLLAYLASGSVKITSPLWRHGVALSGTLQPVSYGDARMNELLETHPHLRRVLAWGVIVSETGFPLVLVLPARAAAAWSATLLGMHVGIAYFMGLNRFLPAFATMHPAVLGLRADLLAGLRRRPAAT